jgi:hypothetical protein
MESTQTIDNVVEQVNLVTRESQKTLKPYKVLQLKLTNGYDIEVFIERAELKLLELLVGEDEKTSAK